MSMNTKHILLGLALGGALLLVGIYSDNLENSILDDLRKKKK